MSKKTAEQFVEQIPVFLGFLDEIKLQKLPALMTEAKPTTTHPLNGKQYVMTGFRDKILTDKLTAVGAEQGSAVRKNTFVLLVKDSLEESSKMTEAKKLGIPIMSVAEFLLKYKL
jgi:NAD-dependent DNA ligase